MNIAIAEAEKAGQKNEVPIGAVIVAENGNVLARAGNQTVETADPTAHAEIVAIRKASIILNNYRLLGTTLYVTVEPCLMCMGAVIHARIAKLVFGTADPKWGACGSLYDFSKDNRLNHRLTVVSGIRENRCRDLMQNFFRARRKPINDVNPIP